jgi:hypothetical protein
LADAADRRFARLGFAISDDLQVLSKKTDNRRAPRRRCAVSAWIRVDGSFAAQQCEVLDLSQNGVRLSVADANRIRNRFILLWSKNGIGRQASIKWRRTTQIGAEFLTTDDLRPIYLARRTADNVAKLQELLRR